MWWSCVNYTEIPEMHWLRYTWIKFCRWWAERTKALWLEVMREVQDSPKYLAGIPYVHLNACCLDQTTPKNNSSLDVSNMKIIINNFGAVC